jgi:hypothetical protein
VRRWLWSRLTPAIGLVILLTLVGCAGDDGEEAAATTTTLGSSTSTSAPSTTTSLESEDVPDPATTGEDFEAILREILAFETWLFEHPDVEPLNVIYTEDANIRPRIEEFVEDLIDKGWRYDDEGPVIHSVSVERRVDPLNVLLQVETSHGPQLVVDEAGELVEQGEGWPRRREQYLLKQGDDGRWRIQNYANNGPVEADES